MRKTSIGAKIKKSFWLYVLLLPSLIILLVFNYGPMYGIIIAFKDYNSVQGIWGSPWASDYGFGNFIRFFKVYNFWTLIKNTLTLSVYQLVVSAICPVILALFVNEIRSYFIV